MHFMSFWKDVVAMLKYDSMNAGNTKHTVTKFHLDLKQRFYHVSRLEKASCTPKKETDV